jgi:calcineurin-binding protein cabin-1
LSGLTRDYHIGTSTTFGADVDFLLAMTMAKSAFGPAWQNFAIRVYWVRARFSVLIGQTIMAINCFCVCADLLSIERPVDAALSMLPRQPLTIQLPNCIEDSVISEERVKEKLEFIDRCQSLDEVRGLYNAGEYKHVVEILTSSLSLADMFNPTVKTLYGADEQESSQRPSPERPAQLLILEDALLKVGREKDALLCAETNLHEVASRLSAQIFSKSAETLKELISNIDKAVSSTNLMNEVSEFVLARMLQSIIKVIDCYMDTAENVAEYFPVTLPWIIAVRLVQFGELSEIPADIVSTTIQPTVGPLTTAYPGKPPLLSILLLRDGHEKLGRHSMCCENDGRFLELALDSLLTCLQDSCDEELVRDIEQCFLCLYGHPNKKAKTKKLQDHGSVQINLTWEKASTVFSFFCPNRQRPYFDGKKSYVTAELENLLRRIIALIPATEMPAVSSKSLLSYLDGICDEMTAFTAETTGSKHPIVLEIFYLLADFYRRNGESIKAIKFYLQDLSYNPQRFDSWAGMAEARARKIGDKLNALDCKIELCKVVERESDPALRSFEMAVNINQSNCTLLEHYGLFCYTLHSFAAQQIKQLHDDFPSFPWLSQLRPEMLSKAGQLFEKCVECCDGNMNSYVPYLMLGKVAEKSGQPYHVLLDKYMKALNWLDKKQAHPRRIDYHNPVEYSIETLAVYHHLHTAVLKILQDVQLEYINLVKFDSLEKYVDIAAKCSFAQTDTHSPMKGAPRWVGGDFSPRSLLEHRRLVLEEHSYAKSLVDTNLECVPNVGIGAGSSENEQVLDENAEESQEKKLEEGVDSKFECAMKETPDVPFHLVGPDDTGQTDEEKASRLAPFEAAVNQEETDQKETSEEERSQGETSQEETSQEEINQEESSQKCYSIGEETDVGQMPLLKKHDFNEVVQSLFEKADDPTPGLLPVDEAMEDIGTDTKNENNLDKSGTGLLPVDEAMEDVGISVKNGDNLDKSGTELLPVDEAMKDIGTNVKNEDIDNSDESGIPATLADDINKAASIEKDEIAEEVNPLPLHESVESAKENEREPSSSPILPISPLPLIEDLCGLPHGLENMDLDLQTPSPEGEDVNIDHTEEDTPATEEIQESEMDFTPVLLAPPIERYMTLVSKCLDAMQLCACRYPEHYKSRYRLAYAYSHIPTHLNLEMARDILWGSPSQEGKQHLQPLFSRKGTNFFQIWKMRIDELERPGSFITYATKCVCLLIEVLGKLEDRQSLLTVIHMLLKKADLSKRYIPENEKNGLIRKAMKTHVDITQEKVAQLRLSGGPHVLELTD